MYIELDPISNQHDVPVDVWRFVEIIENIYIRKLIIPDGERRRNRCPSTESIIPEIATRK